MTDHKPLHKHTNHHFSYNSSNLDDFRSLAQNLLILFRPNKGLKRDETMRSAKHSIIAPEPTECSHKNDLHFSFAGGAILSFFNVGIAHWLIRNTDRAQLKKVYGVSGGALCAAWLLASKDSRSFGYITEQYLNEWKEYVQRLGGRLALQRSLAYHRSLLARYLPEDAHVSCSGRLSIVLLNIKTRKQEKVSHFKTRQDLIDYLIAAMTIPFVNTVIPSKINGQRYVDGGIISNQVICCENVTLCSPFPNLFSPFKRQPIRPHQTILGMNAITSAFNPYSDVHKQFELGYQTAKQFYESPADIRTTEYPNLVEEMQGLLEPVLPALMQSTKESFSPQTH